MRSTSNTMSIDARSRLRRSRNYTRRDLAYLFCAFVIWVLLAVCAFLPNVANAQYYTTGGQSPQAASNTGSTINYDYLKEDGSTGSASTNAGSVYNPDAVSDYIEDVMPEGSAAHKYASCALGSCETEEDWRNYLGERWLLSAWCDHGNISDPARSWVRKWFYEAECIATFACTATECTGSNVSLAATGFECELTSSTEHSGRVYIGDKSWPGLGDYFQPYFTNNFTCPIGLLSPEEITDRLNNGELTGTAEKFVDDLFDNSGLDDLSPYVDNLPHPDDAVDCGVGDCGSYDGGGGGSGGSGGGFGSGTGGGDGSDIDGECNPYLESCDEDIATCDPAVDECGTGDDERCDPFLEACGGYPGVPLDEGPIQEVDGIGIADAPDFGGKWLPTGCPASVPVNAMGAHFVIDTAPICTAAESLSGFVKGFGALAALGIIFGGSGRGSA